MYEPFTGAGSSRGGWAHTCRFGRTSLRRPVQSSGTPTPPRALRREAVSLPRSGSLLAAQAVSRWHPSCPVPLSSERGLGVGVVARYHNGRALVPPVRGGCSMPSDSDRLLIQQIRQGDPRAWETLISRYEGRLLAFVQ